MADKKENNKPSLPTKPPRGNYQIWVILATVAVIFSFVYFGSGSSLKKKTREEFKEMVKNGDVKKVVLIQDQKFAEITLTNDAVNNAKYKKDITTGPFGGNV